jgi:hypothetical protein
MLHFLRQYFENSREEFVRRQANEYAYSLAKATTLSASFNILVEIPHCIEHTLINEMQKVTISQKKNIDK